MVKCALEKLELVDPDMNPDVNAITTIERETCHGWRIAHKLDLVQAQCINLRLEDMIGRMSPLPPSHVAFMALTLQAQTILDAMGEAYSLCKKLLCD